jgi:5'-nucleotidase
MNQRPLIMITNDDGIRSRGLLAAASACDLLGDLLIVAPAHQQSAVGRSKPPGSSGRIFEEKLLVNDRTIIGYAIEGTPAQVVEHGLVELADRVPALVVSGINFGENIGEGITTSGTVGAALEAASFGLPALATSLQTDPKHYFTHDAELDFAVAAHFVRLVATAVIKYGLPAGAELLKIDIPSHATLETPMRWTRLSRPRYFYPVPKPRRALNEPSAMGYEQRADPTVLAPDSDVRAVILDHVVSVTPLVLDMTAPIDLQGLDRWFNGKAAAADNQ